MPFGIDQYLAQQQAAPPPATPNGADFIKRLAAAVGQLPRGVFSPSSQTPTVPQGGAQAPQSYGAYSQGIVDAAKADEYAHPSSLFSWVTGAGRDAAAAKAKAMSPDAYQAYIQSQNAAQAGAVGNANSFAINRANTGVDVNPNNPMASLDALTAAYRNAGTPSGASGGTDVSAGNPIDAQRSFLMRMAKVQQMSGNFAGASDYLTQASKGAPDGAVVSPLNGSLVDANTGAPISGSVQQYNARGAGLTSAAETAPKVQGQLITQGNQAGLDRETTRQANYDKNRYDTVTGFSSKTGAPMSISRADLANRGNSDFVEGSNPFFSGQQDELKTLRTSADSADNGLNLAQQLVGAANGLYTGKGGASLQNARKLAQGAAALTGTKLPDSINNDTSKFEQLQFASQQLVAAASHDLSPRVAQQIYNQIAAVKPGDKSSVQGLRDIITNQIVPTLARRKAMYGATANFYRHNPTRNDASAVLSGQLPTSKFSVKQPGQDVQPGDYFIDPLNGNLRQRPVQ